MVDCYRIRRCTTNSVYWYQGGRHLDALGLFQYETAHLALPKQHWADVAAERVFFAGATTGWPVIAETVRTEVISINLLENMWERPSSDSVGSVDDLCPVKRLQRQAMHHQLTPLSPFFPPFFSLSARLAIGAVHRAATH